MITPAFHVRQNNEFIIVEIKAPYVRSPEVDFYVLDNEFKFSVHPYFLRLRFDSSLIEDGRERCQHDIDEGKFIVYLPKLNMGEEFKDLDLLNVLLSRKREKQPKVAKIEVLSSTENGEEAEEGNDVIDWEVEQHLSDDGEGEDDGDGEGDGDGVSIMMKPILYGFDDKYSGILNKLQNDIPNIVELPNPDETKKKERQSLRHESERVKFNAEHYACDYDDDSMAKHLMGFRPLWKDWEEDTSEGKAVVFSEKDKEDMLKLPRKEYIVTHPKRLLIGLVDIIFAWAYDHRLTEGESTVESAWTISSLSSTLSFLVEFESLQNCAIACCRRAMTYPLVRHWGLFEQVWKDTCKIFSMGKNLVLRCLLDLRRLVLRDETKFILNEIYITDYCVWMQTVSTENFLSLGDKMSSIKLRKSDIELPLLEVEAIINADDCSTDSDDDSKNDSDDVSDD
eukprot:m.38991 g.38991  ORF g.38991 m.38991 type:complete len:452 (-) comp9501_c0_seq2:113-1468(-)